MGQACGILYFTLGLPLLLHNYVTSVKYFSVIKLTFFFVDSSCAISQLVHTAEKAGVTFNRTVSTFILPTGNLSIIFKN